jgi:hypothetical protein
VKLPNKKLDREATYWLIGGVVVCVLAVAIGKGVADGFANPVDAETIRELKTRVDPNHPPPGMFEFFRRQQQLQQQRMAASAASAPAAKP